MRKYWCHVCDEWIDDMPLEQCYLNKNGICDAGKNKCDATRYVSVDTMVRYARRRERKVYALASKKTGGICDGATYQCYMHEKYTYEQAIAERDNIAEGSKMVGGEKK